MDTETKLIVKEAAQEAAKQAVDQTLLSLGINTTNPVEAQKDMAALRTLRELVEDPEVQRDLTHLRRWRKAMDSIESKGVMSAFGLLALGGIAAMWYAIKTKFGI